MNLIVKSKRFAPARSGLFMMAGVSRPVDNRKPKLDLKNLVGLIDFNEHQIDIRNTDVVVRDLEGPGKTPSCCFPDIGPSISLH